MKDISEVLRKKEGELQQLQREVDALRVASRLLLEESESAVPAYTGRPSASTPTYVPPRPAQAAPTAIDAGFGASWEAASKKFP